MSDQPTIKAYSTEEVTVIWQPAKCIHSERCFKGLPTVFNPQARPWIEVQGADTARIVQQVRQCPSGALTYRMENGVPDPTAEADDATAIEVATDGPLLISGPVKLTGQHGEQTIDKPKVALCRCGHSQNKPFCDGSHRKQGFSAS